MTDDRGSGIEETLAYGLPAELAEPWPFPVRAARIVFTNGEYRMSAVAEVLDAIRGTGRFGELHRPRIALGDHG